MSAENRRDGEKLRRRYAGVMQVPIEQVSLTEIEDDGVLGERCQVEAPGHPPWTTAGRPLAVMPKKSVEDAIFVLNARVTALIIGTRAGSDAGDWSEISGIEEELAGLHSAGSVEWVVARVGAVSAALRAERPNRAAALIDEWLPTSPPELQAELRRMDPRLPR